MNTPRLCPICAKPLAPDAPQGLCPECLMKAGFPSGATSPDPNTPPNRTTFVAPTPAALAPHFPHLEVLELIGQGGMGAVYKARQPSLDRLVALKILPPQLSRDPGFAERFTREARALARLSHPNIVAVHDFGQAGGFHHLVMEFVDGTNLRQLLGGVKLGPKEALAIVPPICTALQYAHDQGIVHRDIKPENILLDKTGRVKIADFGLAKIMGQDASPLSLTGAQDVMGTPHYMAPEQLERPREVDHRADIYSLGVVFYQMLTGELPLGRFAPPSRKIEVDVRLDEIVLRALEKEPTLRYQQASALRAEVEHVASTPGTARARPAVEPMVQKLAQALGLPPFAAPPPTGASDAINARADGKQLVVPLGQAKLPLRCVKTNQPVTAAELRTQKFEWIPPVVYLSLLLTPVAFLILYFIFRQHVQLPTPLSARGRWIVRRHKFIAATLAVAGMALFVAGVSGRILPLLLFGLATATAALFYALLKGPTLRLMKLQDGKAWFAGVSPALLAALPPYRANGHGTTA